MLRAILVLAVYSKNTRLYGASDRVEGLILDARYLDGGSGDGWRP